MRNLSISDAADFTGISKRTLQRMCANGEIPGAELVGKTYLLPREWVTENEERFVAPQDGYYGVRAAALFMNVSCQVLRNWVDRGKIRGKKELVNKRYRWWVLIEDVQKYRDEHPSEYKDNSENYSFEDFCVEHEILKRDGNLNDLKIMWNVYEDDYKDACKEKGVIAERL